MSTYASDSDDDVIRRSSSNRIPRDLFSDDSDDDRSRGGSASEAEEDNSLNRREGGPMATGSGGGGGDKDTDDEEEEQRKKEEKKKKDEEKKKKERKGPVRRLMISQEMLMGKNGITALPEIFKDFKFNGKGRERQDLDRILSKLEYWTHILHPKHPFDQCLERIEFLGGKKKIIKTHLKKFRMGMLDNLDGNNDVVRGGEDHDIMENIDATELAESASAFVNAAEGAEQVTSIDDDDDPIPSTSSFQPSNTATVNNALTRNDNEFPDDDDEFFEVIDESAVGKSKSTQAATIIDEMDIDMEDVPDIGDDDAEDNFFQKQIEAQMKRAEEMETQQQQQLKNSLLSAEDGKESESMDEEDTLYISIPNEEISTLDTENNQSSSKNDLDLPVEQPSQTTDSGKEIDDETVIDDNVLTVCSQEDKNKNDDGITLDDLGDNDDDSD